MAYPCMDSYCRLSLSSSPYPLSGSKYEFPRFPRVLPIKFIERSLANTRIYARKSSAKKLKKEREAPKILKSRQSNESPPNEFNGLADEFTSNDSIEESKATPVIGDSELKRSVDIASRNSVLQACTLTSGFIAFLGVIIRQGSHTASIQGWSVVDCSTEISFDFKMWHLQLTVGLVILISSCRFLLLNIWPDFAESSEASNKQVLTSLEPLDYALVAFLPGISEELLFRGALLPFFGTNMLSATAVAGLFGILHLGGGRKYPFAIWATFVGFVYGYATILTSSLFVPMASHAINNLIGGVMWRFTKPSQQKR